MHYNITDPFVCLTMEELETVTGGTDPQTNTRKTYGLLTGNMAMVTAAHTAGRRQRNDEGEVQLARKTFQNIFFHNFFFHF
jgi:hypothetical protein